MTFSAGVPTVWLGLLDLHAGRTSSSSRRSSARVIGGSAAPPAMIRELRRGVRRRGAARLGHDRDEPARHALHAQGQASRALARGRRLALRCKQGRADLRRRHEDRRRRGQGAAVGRQGVRRPAWCAARGSPAATSRTRAATRCDDGWFPTGDVATIDADGYMQITDRSKDVIKSGGEWISSIDLENIAVAHPGGRRGRGDRRAPPEVGRAAAPRRGEEAGRRSDARGAARASTTARSRSGGCPTTSSSSTSCRTPRPASC